MTEHKTQLVEWQGREAEIDVDIAPLVLELWRADIDTLNSCQNNVPEDYVWIQFGSAKDAEQFLDIVICKYEKRPTSLYQRALETWDWEGLQTKNWKYSTLLHDCNLIHVPDDNDETVTETHSGHPCFHFTISVRFPRRDLKIVTERMRLYNFDDPDDLEAIERLASCPTNTSATHPPSSNALVTSP